MIGPGTRFGRLTVVQLDPRSKGLGRKRMAAVRCDCGNRRTVRVSNLEAGHTTSCGCFRIEQVKASSTKHGHRLDGNEQTPTYEAWRTMIRNCTCVDADRYADYGALGVGVCSRWTGEGAFIRFLEDMGPKPDGYLLSRRDKEKDFTPENTYWATRREVDRNKRSNTMYTVGEKTQCLVDWANEYKIPKSTLHYRVVTKGMTMRDALDVGKGCPGRVLP